jgi:hypothetical protein
LILLSETGKSKKMKRVIFFSVIIFSLITGKSTAQITDALISGSLTVGSVLTAGTSTAPATGNFVLYEWFWSDNTSLGISPTHSITSADQGKIFYVKASEYEPPHTIKAGPFTSSNTTAVNFTPVSSVPIVTGTPNSGVVLVASYTYSDTENNPESGSTLQWFRSPTTDVSEAVPIAGANSLFYLVTSVDYNYYITFGVIPRSSAGSQTGSLTMSSFTVRINNAAPVASAVLITGPGTFNVNDVLIGDYNYSDAEGDQEGASDFRWIRSGNNTISADDEILSVTTDYYKLVLADTGKYIFFRVMPVAAAGNPSGLPVTSGVSGRVNTPPYVKNVGISGTVQVYQTITGTYTFGDRDGDNEDMSATIYRWYRDGSLIPGVNTKSYLVSEDDEGFKLKFEVTPVSSTGYPSAGLTQSYQYPTTVPASSTLPIADQLCINGINSEGNTIEGKFHFSNTLNSTKFKFRWMRDNDTIPGATSRFYQLTALDNNRNIYFVVYPISKSGLTHGLTAKSDALARIMLVKDQFFTTDPDTILAGTPAGGNFYGDGIKTAGGVSRFSPSSLDYTQSPFTINYQLIINNPNHTCQQTDPKEINISPVTMYFEGLASGYCTNEEEYDTIYVRNTPAASYNYRFGMTGPNAIVSQSGNRVVLDPKLMRPGFNIDVLYFQCDVDIWILYPIFYFTTTVPYQQPVIVYQAPSIMVEGIKENQVFCSSQWEFKLKPTPAGGILSGGPIKTPDIFDPKKGSRNDIVTYTYTESSTGCVSTRTYPVVINPAPVVKFELADTCIANASDSIVFLNRTTSTDHVKRWEWKFLESGGSSIKNDSSVKFLYKIGGIHNVELLVKTVNDCPDTLRHSLDLGNKPVADFYWQNECLHPSATDKLYLFDNSVSQSAIDSTFWKFPDGTVQKFKGINSGKIMYPKTNVGYLNVQYFVKTNYYNCHDDTIKKVYIRPTRTISADSTYLENFEKGNGGWVPYTENNKIWSFGTPNRIVINKASSGIKAWYTSYPLVNQKKDSASVISPCFDFTNVERPMIKLMLWKRFDRDRDGAALQYKIGDQPGWNYVGSYDDGINWYNSVLIKGKPGDGTLGWTAGSGNSKDAGYIESSNKLDSLAGKMDVKFRISYASDGTSNSNDGIAFDSIWIGRRTRGILLEHFTNNSSAASTVPTNTVSSLANRWTSDVINIQYHTNFPGTDPYYDANPADAGARFLFYGLTKAPYTFIDGGTDNPNFASLFDYSLLPFDSTKIYKRSMVNPLFRINITAKVSSGKTLHVSGTVKALKPVNAENLTLYIAVTQKRNTLNSKQYYNIFRKFIPDAGGTPMPKTMATDQVFTLIEKTWNYSGFENSNMEVIVFIQNNITKVVYQAESDIQLDNVVGIEKTEPAGTNEFSIWPNPSSGKLTVEFDKPLESETDIKIYDFSGTLVRTYKTSVGDFEYVIDNHGLKNGIYLVRVSSGGIDKGYKKLVVSQNR